MIAISVVAFRTHTHRKTIEALTPWVPGKKSYPHNFNQSGKNPQQKEL
jgi:hypothetical protein